jgi:MFS transporter, putative metabolite:H+ symporter
VTSKQFWTSSDRYNMPARCYRQTGGGVAPPAPEHDRAVDQDEAAAVLNLEQISRRLDRLPLARFHVGVLVIASASLLFDTVDIGITGFVLAILRTTWHFDVQTIGVVSAIGLSGYLVGAFSCGFVADRIGRRKVILLTLIFYSVFSAARGLSNNIAIFTVLNFFTYAFVGAESSTVPPYLAELWPARARGKLTGWMMAFFGIGKSLAPLWVLLVIPSLGWRWALLLTAPFALIGGAMRFALPESPRWLMKVGRISEAEEVLTSVESKVRRQTGRPLRPLCAGEYGNLRVAPGTMRPHQLLNRHYRRVTCMLWTAWFAQYGVMYAFEIFVPTILSSEGFSMVKSFEFSAVIYGGVVPAFILGGRVVEWLDRKYTILLGFSGAGLFGTLFGLATTSAEIMLFGALTTSSLALGSTGIYAYTPELYPTEVRATGMGVASAWGRAGAVTLLLVFGTFYSTQGKSLLFIISDSALLGAFLVVARYGPSTRGRRLEETSLGTVTEPIPLR